MAGESARDLARRQREKAERLVKSAELYERGADGEEATAQALAGLPTAEWTVFHDVRWPGRKLANVDHVVVGPGGVFVIDSKNWSGRVEVRDNVLRQNGYQRETTVAAAAEAAIAVSLVTPDLPGRLAVPVLCFVRDESVTGWARDVIVCSTSNVAAMLLSRPTVLDEATIRKICVGLDLSLRNASGAGNQQGRVSRRSPAQAPARRPAYAAPTPLPRSASPSASARRTKSRRLSLGDWLKGGLGLAIVGSAVFAPSVYQSAITGVGGLVAEVIVPKTDPTPIEEMDKGEKKRDRQTQSE